MPDEPLAITHWKVQQRLREARARSARIGKLVVFGTLAATSPTLSRLAKELNARWSWPRGTRHLP